MKFLDYNLDRVQGVVFRDDLGAICRISSTDFTRERKVKVRDIIMYNLNNKGLTNKMELYDFINDYDLTKVSAPGFLKQREKLDPVIFLIMNEVSMSGFYNKFPDEVKTYKGYRLFAIDGSDCEVPNSPETRERYKPVNSKKYDRVARIKLSNCFDVLNKRVLDTEIEEYKHSERDLARKHIDTVNGYIDDNNSIYIMDRGYFSLSFVYDLIKNNTQFVIRLKDIVLKNEQKKMKSNDEEIEIEYQYDRIKNNKNKYPELYNFYESGNTLKVRFVKIKLSNGKTEKIITNISKDKLSIEDMKQIYNKRWGIETSYHELKNSMKITNLSSSKDVIIRQEIYAQMVVYNIIQAMIAASEQQIKQEKYKNEMKITLLLEEDKYKRSDMYLKLMDLLIENLVPIKKGRYFERRQYSKNQYSINKRKSY